MKKGEYYIESMVLPMVLLIMSCSPYSRHIPQKPDAQESVLRYVDSGFVPGYGTSRLFCDQYLSEKHSRIKVLLDYLGYDEYEWATYDISSDQAYIRFWGGGNPNTKRALILGKNTEPKVYEFPPVTVLDDNNNPIVWADGHGRFRKYIFAHGETLYFPADYVLFDNSREYFCSGGRYYDYESEMRKEIPINIYSVQNPSTPLITSSLVYPPDKIVTTKEKVYLFGRNYQDKLPYDMTCEVYSRQDNGLTLMTTFMIHCPLHWGARWFYPEYYDEESNLLLLRMERAFLRHEYYLFNIESHDLVKIKDSVCGQLSLIDPNLFYDIIRVKTGEGK